MKQFKIIWQGGKGAAADYCTMHELYWFPAVYHLMAKKCCILG